LINKLFAWIRIIRPPIVLISCLGALVGGLNTGIFLGVELSIFQIIMVILGAGFLAAGLMVHNDVTDLESDKINRPHKSLPSGVIGVKTAYITGLILMILSIIIALLINIKDQGVLNWYCGTFTAVLVIIGIYYNHYGKYHGIFGHIAVAIGVGAIPYWGSIAVFPTEYLVMLPLAFAIFTQEIGREIMVCAGDLTGDIKSGYKTIPVRLGRPKAMYVALFFYLAFIPIYLLPVFDWIGIGVPKIFGNVYLIGGTLFAVSLLLTWILTYRIVLQNNEKKIWAAFEKYERTGTRLMVIVFQIFLLLEVFY
jgi:geranylgeranylglycerol-phosphate geranylgeranyltransferase